VGTTPAHSVYVSEIIYGNRPSKNIKVFFSGVNCIVAVGKIYIAFGLMLIAYELLELGI
jgi:hypothetical protein